MSSKTIVIKNTMKKNQLKQIHMKKLARFKIGKKNDFYGYLDIIHFPIYLFSVI